MRTPRHPERREIVHAYGVLARQAAGVAVAGIGGAPVLTRVVGPLRVLMSVLDPKRYGREVWAAHGRDPTWVRDVAREHHAVLQAWTDGFDVVPFRLPSLHAGEAVLRDAMERRLPGLLQSLESIRGQEEWGLKIFAEPVRDTGASPEATAPKSGRDYLLRRVRKNAERGEGSARREAAAVDVHRAFVAGTTRALLKPPQDAALSGRTAPMLLNAAYLAARGERDVLRALAARWARRAQPSGVRVELTGPWPAYHFASACSGSGGSAA